MGEVGVGCVEMCVQTLTSSHKLFGEKFENSLKSHLQWPLFVLSYYRTTIIIALHSFLIAIFIVIVVIIIVDAVVAGGGGKYKSSKAMRQEITYSYR